MRVPAAGQCPGDASCVALDNAEGAGNAGCRPHPWPACNKKRRRQVPQARPEQPGIPCAMVLRLIAGSPRCTGLCSHRRLKRNWFRSRLDPSVGRSGPPAFAVREAAFVGAHTRAAQPHGHRIPPPTSVTIASRPSRGSRMEGRETRISEKWKRNIFAIGAGQG